MSPRRPAGALSCKREQDKLIGRSHLTTQASNDDGLTWNEGLLLDKDVSGAVSLKQVISKLPQKADPKPAQP